MFIKNVDNIENIFILNHVSITSRLFKILVLWLFLFLKDYLDLHIIKYVLKKNLHIYIYWFNYCEMNGCFKYEKYHLMGVRVYVGW